jgi:arylsulfatase A-like enzyme
MMTALARPWTVIAALSASSRPRIAYDDTHRLAAGWIALGFVIASMRIWILQLAGESQPSGATLLHWFPLAVYQDILFVLTSGWLAGLVLRAIGNSRGRIVARLFCWAFCLTAAWYSLVSVEIFRFLSTPLTYRLIAMSDNLRGIRSSMDAALTQQRVAFVASAPLIVLLVAAALALLARGLVSRVQLAVSRRSIRLAIAAYAFVAWCATRTAELDAAVFANPHVALLTSCWDRGDPFVEGSYLESDLDDFKPIASRNIEPDSRWHGRAAGLNVIMLVMESVGTWPLSHYGSRYDTTPELTRLAMRGLTFDRVYASQPYTSNAIAGMFCSVYPWHGWRSLSRRDPNLKVTGLGNVLQSAGYRTALLHTGDMQFDNEKRFLQSHGFAEVHDVWSLQSVLSDNPDAKTPPETPGTHLHLPDELLVPAATKWIDAEPGAPFFLTLWTIQTHHPYYSEPSDRQFVTHDAELNRYLNAIRVSDKLLGDLYRQLEARGLSESTLIVVLGDHGEAFGQHGQRTHSKTIYDEELRIPLVMISPHLTDRPQRLDVLGQQLDIGPAILDLLGLDAPGEWQGRSLFSSNRTNRAYFFTGFHQYLFGVVEGDRKYIWNASTARGSMFDLRQDPGERVDLIRSQGGDALHQQLHRRLASWAYFQNRYLETLLSSQQ